MPPYESINLHPPSHQPTALSTATYDVICIGSGWAGRVLASRVIKAGLTALIIENELVGGDCPFWACIPSKVLLRSEEALEAAEEVGGARERVKPGHALDVDAVFKRRDMFTSMWNDENMLVPMVESSGAHLVRGTGKIIGEKKVEVTPINGDALVVIATHAVAVCTGSEPIIPNIPGLAEATPWNPRHATSASKAPERLIVLGAGAVGCEMATAYASFGSKVTLISTTQEILPKMEAEAGKIVREAFMARGVDVFTSTKIEKVLRAGNGLIRADAADGKVFEANEILVATGRKAKTSDIGLERFGINTTGSPIPVDDSLRVTGIASKWLYAAGDVNGRHPLTHGSKYHGRIIANAILAQVTNPMNENKPWDSISATADTYAMPQVIFTNPTVASVGLTKQATEKTGIKFKTINAPSQTAASRIRADNPGPGWAQWIVEEESNKLIGATFVDKDAADLLHASTVAIVGEMTLDKLAHAVPCFPTMSEVYLNLLEAVGL